MFWFFSASWPFSQQATSTSKFYTSQVPNDEHTVSVVLLRTAVGACYDHWKPFSGMVANTSRILENQNLRPEKSTYVGPRVVRVYPLRGAAQHIKMFTRWNLIFGLRRVLSLRPVYILTYIQLHMHFFDGQLSACDDFLGQGRYRRVPVAPVGRAHALRSWVHTPGTGPTACDLL